MRVVRANQLFSGQLSPSASIELVRSSGARFLLADCQHRLDLQSKLRSILQSEQHYGCATVYTFGRTHSETGSRLYADLLHAIDIEETSSVLRRGPPAVQMLFFCQGDPERAPPTWRGKDQSTTAKCVLLYAGRVTWPRRPSPPIAVLPTSTRRAPLIELPISRTKPTVRPFRSAGTSRSNSSKLMLSAELQSDGASKVGP